MGFPSNPLSPSFTLNACAVPAPVIPLVFRRGVWHTPKPLFRRKPESRAALPRHGMPCGYKVLIGTFVAFTRAGGHKGLPYMRTVDRAPGAYAIRPYDAFGSRFL